MKRDERSLHNCTRDWRIFLFWLARWRKPEPTSNKHYQGWPLAAQIGRAVLQQKIGETWERQHQHEQALGAYVRAETTLGMEFDSPKQEWWQAWLQVQQGKMGVYYWRNQPHLIGDIMEKVRPAVAEHGMNIQLAKFYNSLASIHWRRDRYRVAQETLDLCQSALDVSLETGTASEIALMRFSVGFSQLWHGDLEAAEQAFQATLALAEQTGDLDRQLACLIYLGITYRKRGQVEPVRKLALQSLGVAEMLQRMVYIGTAKANLAWVAWRLGDLSESQRYAGAALAAMARCFEQPDPLSVSVGGVVAADWGVIGAGPNGRCLSLFAALVGSGTASFA